MKISQSKLKNGLKVLICSMPDVRSLATMLFVGTGSRYENDQNNGISHFLEHMVFKGTEKFSSSLKVASAIEGIGGRLNAWTDQDHTNYYTIVPFSEKEKGMEVVSQLVLHPLLRKEDLKMERGVILEEMNRRWDAPEDYVWELAIEQMWPNQPLGWPVIGQSQVIKKIDIDEFKQYRQKWYRPSNMVLVLAGNIKKSEGLNLANKYFAHFSSSKIEQNYLPATDNQAESQVKIYNRKTDQAHLVLGFKTFSRFDKNRYALNVLNTILGVGMSSRLFTNIREKRGLCYSVSSHLEFYSDAGGFFVHAGLNTQKLEEAILAIKAELVKFITKPVDKKELEQAKKLILGGLDLSADSSTALATIFGKQLLLHKEIETFEQIGTKIKKVTPKDIIDIAKQIFDFNKANLTIIAPLSDSYGDKFKKIIVD